MNYIVIKCGGSVFEALPDSFYKNVVELKQSGQWQPIVVHGGGPLITSLLKKYGIRTHFVKGLRVTTKEVLDIVEMVLSGSVNKKVVRKLIQFGGNAMGISGVDGELLNATPTKGTSELGFVGEVSSVNDQLLENVCDQGYIPVISPLGIDKEGQRYNINGDMAASAIAQSLSAKLCFMSDIPGIYGQHGEQQVVLHQVTKAEAEKMIASEVISGGMIPKVNAAIDSLVHHVPEAAILNGLQEDSLLDFCQGKEIGTKLIIGEEANHV